MTDETGNATAIYTSCSTVELTNCTVIYRHVQYHPNGEYPDAEFSTIVDGIEATDIVYQNCTNGYSIEHKN